jgi:hypothetical protein
MTSEEKFGLNRYIYGEPREACVDMRSLFEHLVQVLGSKQAIDPIKKEDALWNVIDLFTKVSAGDLSDIY